MIQAQALIDKFRYALDNKWGYIWGTSGTEWTAAKQQQKVNYMVINYGADWKKNADAKKDNYYSAADLGSKWIGHTVADCSGLFVWAFKQLGGAIAHGSNSIYDRYCTTKGKITADIRKTMLPGTAVFTGDESKHGHIGLYVGNGKCIEASGTVAGVCTSNLTAGKWTYYGLLKNVDYSASEAEKTPSAPTDDKPTTETLPTLKRGMKGEYVSLLQTKLVNKGYSVGPCGIDGDFGSATLNAVKQFQRDNGLAVDGIVGKNTWSALNDASVRIIYYSVIIPGQTAKQADAIIAQYKGAYKEEERG